MVQPQTVSAFESFAPIKIAFKITAISSNCSMKLIVCASNHALQMISRSFKISEKPLNKKLLLDFYLLLQKPTCWIDFSSHLHYIKT